MMFAGMKDFVAKEALQARRDYARLVKKSMRQLLSESEVASGEHSPGGEFVVEESELPTRLRDGSWIFVVTAPVGLDGSLGDLLRGDPPTAEIVSDESGGALALESRGGGLPFGRVLLAPSRPIDTTADRHAVIDAVDSDTASPLAREIRAMQAPQAQCKPVLTNAAELLKALRDELVVDGRSIRLVQGPPGCGKTTLIGELAPALGRKRSVLLTAFTNRAVDEALRCSAPNGDGVSLRRLGNARVCDELKMVKPSRGFSSATGVLATTLHQVVKAAGRDEHARFDVAIVDEASQVTMADLCAVAAVAAHIVLVGDHRQLPPVIVQQPSGQSEIDTWRTSAFELLATRMSPLLLKHSRRMNSPVCDFVSRKYYDCRLEAHPNIAEITMPRLSAPFGLDSDRGVLHVSIPRERWSPENEAAHVADAVVAIEERYGQWLSEQEEKGRGGARRYLVSSPTRAQVAQVKRALAERNVPIERYRVDTVERNQGQTASIALLSVGTENEKAQDGRHGANWLLDDRRWNVALSRGRFRCVIVSSSAFDNHVRIGAEDLVRRVAIS